MKNENTPKDSTRYTFSTVNGKSVISPTPKSEAQLAEATRQFLAKHSN